MNTNKSHERNNMTQDLEPWALYEKMGKNIKIQHFCRIFTKYSNSEYRVLTLFGKTIYAKTKKQKNVPYAESEFSKMVSLFSAGWRPDSKPTCYLHIGLGRTGTTSLQYFFSHHSRKLLEYGIWYPLDILDYEDTLPEGNCGKFSRTLLRDGTKKELDNLIYNLCVQAMRRKKALLLSSENFSYADPANISKFMEVLAKYFVYEIIVYIRDPLDYYYSLWTQNVKSLEMSLPFDAFLSLSIHTDLLLFTRNTTKIHAISYEKNKQNTIWAFFDSLGLPSEAICSKADAKSSFRNRSIDNSLICLLRELATIPYYKEHTDMHALVARKINKALLEGAIPNLVYSRPDPELAEYANAAMDPVFNALAPYLSRSEVIHEHPPLAKNEPRLKDAAIRRSDIRLVLEAVAEYAELPFNYLCKAIVARSKSEKLTNLLSTTEDEKLPPNMEQVRALFESVASLLQEREDSRI